MPPPKLSYGLNLPTKKPLSQRLGPPGSQKRKKTIFDSDSEGDDHKAASTSAIEISTLGGLDESSHPAKPAPTQPPAKRKPPPGAPTGKPNIKPLIKNSIFAAEDEDGDEQDAPPMPLGLNPAKNKGSDFTNLSALRSSRKHAEDAQQLDPSIYSYDAVYDSLHAQTKKKAATAETGASAVPRYMTSLLRSAEIRKRDQLRARDRLLAREREAEGDEFADKEKFVTSAYKAQQEELRRVEAEEAERERREEERRKQSGGAGLVGFYRDMLSRDEKRHEEVVKAAEEAARRVQAGEAGEAAREEEAAEAGAEEKREKSEAQIAAELNAKGAHIAINEEGQIVDKRQLLSAGLNVAPKPKPSAAAETAAAAAAARAAASRSRLDSGQQAARAGQRARQTEMIAAQLEEQARREAEAEAARQKEIADRSRSRKTEGDVMSAKERYLARKREREQAGKNGP
ncbi:splicing regulator NSRP1-like domain-containing protein [Aspergillus clavatus NRRL 1]|uniref:Nuclear speckle splicing regulatory protein 1 N-terminal domain-containing protein n=1 Tax=Aspergillus clavatus (strain ATCC 1007 / CBS 513.65 / DSM 816 / NCTC 3887 / NRRL 1 / QM 1276 / 107) TaxID=344612 RepID=A1CST7_ASPCL|nr:uncharacterized protein ACLA_080580 [Aspergillus clavatus NRRL 1]EAW06374.1 conserved hypothetical protein [Aspergillus clavatus NRRL 1]